MRKYIAVAFLGGMMMLAVSGCGHEHQWVGATCTEPQKCMKCDETLGEPLGHDYKEATCQEPKTCKRCSETEGEALGHKMSEADYENAATCSVCGFVDGEPLKPDFVQYELADRIHGLDETVEYKTICYENDELETVGELKITEYETIESDKGHEALEGYVWKKVVVEATFGDENANTAGVLTGFDSEDYYDIKFHDDSAEETENGYTFAVKWNGEEYKDCLSENESKQWGKWTKDNKITLTITDYIRVPEGYDGTIIGFYNRKIDWEDGKYINDIADEDTIFFRLD